MPSNVRPLAPYGNLLKKMFSDHFPTQKLGKSSCGRLIYLHNMTFCLHALQHFRRGAVCFWGAVVWHSGWGVDSVMSGTHHLTHQSHGIFCNVFTLANILSLQFLLNCHIFNALTSHDPLTKRHDVIFLFKQLWEHHPLFQISWKNAIWWYSYHFLSERLPCHTSPGKNAIWWYPYHVPIRNTVKQLWEHPCHKSSEKMLSDDTHIIFPSKNTAKQLWEHTPITNLLKKCYLMMPISLSMSHDPNTPKHMWEITPTCQIRQISQRCTNTFKTPSKLNLLALFGNWLFCQIRQMSQTCAKNPLPSRNGNLGMGNWTCRNFKST